MGAGVAYDEVDTVDTDGETSGEYGDSAEDVNVAGGAYSGEQESVEAAAGG